MPVIKNNLYYELTTETQTKPVSAVKIQLDVLDGCVHACPGCFVHRRGNAPEQNHLKECREFVKRITDKGILVDEVLIGPTDCLSSENFYDVMQDSDLLAMINENSPILAFTTTFLEKDLGYLKRWIDFLHTNINTDTEIEVGIATNPMMYDNKEYINQLKRCIAYIDNNLKHECTYTFIVNIRQYDLDYEKIHDFVVKEFETTIDFIPSVSRSHKPNIILRTLNQFNAFFEALPEDTHLNNIMVDHSHAGHNYTVLNFKKGKWYLSPFMYENMALYDEQFEVKDLDDAYYKTLTQIERAKGTECENCDMFFSCYNRKVILLRDYLGVDTCIAPKENMIKNIYNYNKSAAEMYNWEGYSVEADKQGYRKKFLVTEEGDERLEEIKKVYHANRKG